MQLDKRYLLIGIFAMILISGCSPEGEENYEIVGDTVMINDSLIYIGTTPHTITHSDWVEAEFQSKVFDGEVDFLWGFDTEDGVYPTKAERWTGSEWVSWNPDGHTNYDFMGMDRWYYSLNTNIVAGTTYKVRYWLEVPYGADSKYFLAFKPSSETIGEAIDNEHFWVLDPWVEHNLEADLVVYYSFDWDDNCSDMSGNDNNCTIHDGGTSNPSKAAGILNDSYLFDGSNFLNTSNFSLGPAFSVSMWVYDYDNASNYYAFGNELELQIGLDGGTDTNVSAVSGLNNGWGTPALHVNNMDTNVTWFFVAYSYDGAKEELYVFNATNYSNNSHANTGQLDGSHTYYIGDVLGGNGMVGRIDEFSVWNRSLLFSEINALWNNYSGLEYGSTGVTIINHTISPTANAYVDDIINCSANIQTIAENMTGNITWVKDGTLNGTYGLNFTNYTNNSFISSAVTNRNLGSGSEWVCSVFVNDTYGNTTTSSVSKTISTISIDNCSTQTEVIFNASLYDEESNTFLDTDAVNTTIEIDVELFSQSTNALVGNYSHKWVNYTNATICIAANSLDGKSYDYYIDSSFSASNRVTEFWFLDKGNLTNTSTLDGQTTKTNYFMDLKSADSTTFLIDYVNEFGVDEDDVIIHTYRKYIGDGVFREVERSKEDDAGDTHAHLVEEDVLYYFVVTQNGTNLYTSATAQVRCLSDPCTLELEEDDDFVGIPTDFDLIDDGWYSITSDSNAREVTLSFSGENTSQWNLTIYRYSHNISQYSKINESSLTTTTGSIVTGLPQTAGNVTFVARVERDGTFLQDSFVDMSGDWLDELRVAGGVVLGSLIVLTMGLMAVTEGAVVILFFVVGVIFAGLLNLLNLNWAAVITLAIIGGLLFWKLGQSKKA